MRLAWTAFTVNMWGVECDWYTDTLDPLGVRTVHYDEVPFDGLWLGLALKRELCLGVVFRSATMRRRIYCSGLPVGSITATQEVDNIWWSVAASVIFYWVQFYPAVNVSLTEHRYEPLEGVLVQREIMTHNHRKVHVPFELAGEIPG